MGDNLNVVGEFGVSENTYVLLISLFALVIV
jgi:hypothetical protein